MSAWLWLFMAILLEVAGTMSLKITDGLTKLVPSILTFIFYCLSFSSLAIALKKLDLSIAYAIWSGLGTAVIACIGVYYFGETMTFIKLLSIVLIVLGVIGLNLA